MPQIVATIWGILIVAVLIHPRKCVDSIFRSSRLQHLLINKYLRLMKVKAYWQKDDMLPLLLQAVV